MQKKELSLIYLNSPILSKNPLISNIKQKDVSGLEFDAIFTSRHKCKQHITIKFYEFQYSIENNSSSLFLYTRKLLNKLISIASKNAMSFSEENFCVPNKDEKDQILKLVERSINKSLFIVNKNFNIFHLVSEIFFNMVISNHILKNGNKRMGMSLLIILLQSFGYYFRFSKIKPKIPKEKRNYFWEKEVIKFFNLRNKFNKADSLIKREIYKWIKKNSYFLNNFTIKK